MSSLYIWLATYLKPFACPFFLLLLLLVIAYGCRYVSKARARVIMFIAFILSFWIIFMLVSLNATMNLWLSRLSSPFSLIFSALVLPAIFLLRNRYYKFFLLMPLAGICLAITDVFYNYSKLPAGTPFEWFLIRSGYLITGVAGVLVIAEYFFKAETFRKITRLTTLLVLLYGGFMFRQSQSDYEKMLERRRDQTPGIMNIKETVPVMKSDNRLTYLPSAPCRFSADGGYVQGCNMELAQRFMQLDFAKIRSGDPSQNALMGRAAGAFLVIIIMVFIGARWWCGWICPLATLGDVFDFFRRRFGLPCYKPSRPVKLTCLISGLSVGGFGLLLAKAYANIDSDGKFMGCKIPLYPFCKICPGQQVCPVASRGPMAYTPLPGWEWLFGFFRMGVILLLVFFVISFAASRRLWCRFCPMGMLGGLFNRGGLMALKKNPLKCNGCGICNEVCPMDIHLVQKEMEKEDVSSFDCVYCLKCVNKCPQDDCLSMEFAGHKVLESKFRD